MIRTAFITSMTLAALAACSTITQPQLTAEQYVLDAQRIAGEDLKFLMPVCNPQPAVRAVPSPAMDQSLAKLINQAPPDPGQAFDNLFYVGSTWVSAWVLKTSDGLILIDALNNKKEAADLIEGGMRRLGLDPAQIRYVLVTHGHGDHYGGAQMIAERYRARVVASEIDWKMMETVLEFDSTLWDRPPKREIAVHDGDTLTLGDTTVRFMITPGHTLGTITPVFEVRDGGRVHKAMIWGGTSFNFGRDMGRLDSYIAQTERIRELSMKWGIDVPLSNHPGYDGTVAKLKTRALAAVGSNPFVSGQPVVDRAMRVLNTCARAQKARFLLTAQGETENVHATTSGVQGLATLHAEDDDHVAEGSLAFGKANDVRPVAFPYSAYAGVKLGLHTNVKP